MDHALFQVTTAVGGALAALLGKAAIDARLAAPDHASAARHHRVPLVLLLVASVVVIAVSVTGVALNWTTSLEKLGASLLTVAAVVATVLWALWRPGGESVGGRAADRPRPSGSLG